MVIHPSTMKSIPKTFLRKNRKFLSPYKTNWHFTFNQQQQSLQFLQNLTLNSNKTLINSLNFQPNFNAYQFIIKTLISNSQFTQLNSLLTHLEKLENFQTPEFIFVYLIRVYGEKGRIFEAIDLFFRIPNFRCVPTLDSFNSLLFVVCKTKKIAFLKFVPNLLIKCCRDFNIRVDESSFMILINALCRINRVDYAIKLLNCMIVDEELDPNGKVCSLILWSLCRVKVVESDYVLGVFEGMKKIGFCASVIDFRVLIKFLVRQGKGREAYDVLCDMKREGIKPDIVCYTMVLRGLVDDGDFLRVDELFDEVLVFGLVPNVWIFNAYVNGLCKQKKVNDALRMISCMKEMGCRPNLITYRTVLEAFGEVKDLSRVRDVWKEIKLKGIRIDMHTYGIMIDALVNGGEVIDACNLLEEMLSNCTTPVSSVFDDIICSLCCKGLVSEVLHALDKACVKGVVVPGYRAWEALLRKLNLNLGYERVLLADLVNVCEE